MTVTPATPGWHVHWGQRPYDAMHAAQERLVAARADGTLPNLLLTGEHPPVVTLGRKTPGGFPATVGGIPVVVVERGGEATYHGPGQLVAYPIVHLTEARRDLHRFQRDLEEIGIRVCADFGLEAGRVEGKTGVWVGPKKIMSLGIAVRRWVTWHGLALNVGNDLAPFRAFNPCGLDGGVMTSLSDRLGRPVTVADALPSLVRHAGDLLPGGPFAPHAWADLPLGP
ncbi:MAG: lipoyl(octanoyl) transferase LipB [Planctomycetota bacterium]